MNEVVKVAVSGARGTNEFRLKNESHKFCWLQRDESCQNKQPVPHHAETRATQGMKNGGRTMLDHVVLCPSLLPQCNRYVHLSGVSLRISMLPWKCLCGISNFIMFFCFIT